MRQRHGHIQKKKDEDPNKATMAAAVIADGPIADSESESEADNKMAWAVLPPGLRAGCAAPVLMPELLEGPDNNIDDDEHQMFSMICSLTNDNESLIDSKPCNKPECKTCPSTSTPCNAATTIPTTTSTTKTKQKMPRMPKINVQKKRKAEPPSRERVLQVAKLIEQSELKAPEVAKGEVLVLHDSGAAPNIENHKNHFPGSTLSSSTSKDSFSTATGQPFGSSGEMSVLVETQEGHKRTFTLKNADVAIPILSAGLLCDDDHDALFKKVGS